ncbi:MAG: hypothetical protein ACYCPN_07215, partial [Thermoplasmata archaeon]
LDVLCPRLSAEFPDISSPMALAVLKAFAQVTRRFAASLEEIEKAFETLKGPLNMEPIRYRLFNQVDAYLTVVCHMAYLLRAGLRWRLKEAGRRESVEEALEMLREVYWVRERMGEGYLERWGPLTKEKVGLIKALGLKGLVRA